MHVGRSKDGTARLWTADQFICKAVLSHESLEEDLKQITSMAWIDGIDGKELITGTFDGMVRIWKRGSTQVKVSVDVHVGPVLAVSQSRSLKWIATGSADSDVVIFTLEGTKLKETTRLQLPGMRAKVNFKF